MRAVLTGAGLVALALAAAAAGLLVGEADLGRADLRDVVLRLRGYRVLVAFGVGAALAVGGVLVQGLFRNPLASPSILGTTAGAGVGGQAALVIAQFAGVGTTTLIAPEMLLPVGCVGGALGALALLLAVSRRRDDTVVLLLTGFLLSSLFLSAGAFLTSMAQENWELGRAVVAFALGGVAGAGPRQAMLVWVLVAFGLVAAWRWARHLDLLLSGDEEARSLGVDTRQLRRWVIVWTALLTAGAVATAGGISFVGLVVPHVCRSFVGVAHRRLVPTAAMLGGTFVVLCDVLARLSPTRAELPLGVVTGLIGAPLFLVLLMRSRRRAVLGA